MTGGALSHLRVLDLSRVLAGPTAGQILADLGAEVIKIERPGKGDDTRQWGPPWLHDTAGRATGESAYYLSANRGKQSVAVDIATAEGQRLVRGLAARCDVVLENFKVGGLARYGLDYATLAAAHPGLVHCSITGFGETGPYARRPGYDFLIQGMGGLMSITGEADGSPVRVGVALADIGAGMYATQAILAALLSRELGDGTGQKVDVSLLDGQAAWMSYMASNYFATGDPPTRMGSKHPTITPYQAFETADDYVVVACASEHIWPRFCEAIGRPDLETDERFATNADRVEHRAELDPILEAELAAYTTEEVVSRCREHDVPVSPVNDMAAVFSHPQIRARGMRQSVDHPTAGEIEMPGSPMHFSRTPATIRHHPPLLGEHTVDVLSEYGYTDADIDRLRDADAI